MEKHVPFVLVHGGGFAGSCWDLLVPLLDPPVHVVDLPGRGRRPADLASVTVHDFVEAVVEEIVAKDLVEVVLVGHSLAGITLPGVSERLPGRVRRLVFVACVVPPPGKSVAEVFTALSPAVVEAMRRLGDDIVTHDGKLHPDLATAMLCNDMDGEQRAFTLACLVPEAATVTSEPADLTGLRHPIPRTYIRLLRDEDVILSAQDQMIANLGDADVIDLDAGHMVMISRPAELARILNALKAGP